MQISLKLKSHFTLTCTSQIHQAFGIQDRIMTCKLLFCAQFCLSFPFRVLLWSSLFPHFWVGFWGCGWWDRVCKAEQLVLSGKNYMLSSTKRYYIILQERNSLWNWRFLFISCCHFPLWNLILVEVIWFSLHPIRQKLQDTFYL